MTANDTATRRVTTGIVLAVGLFAGSDSYSHIYTIARDHGHRGAPVIEVALRYDGVLEDARVQGASGDAALDQAALHILKLASPFNPFPPELAAKYRIMRFAYQWQFVTGRASGSFVTSATEDASRP